MPKKSKPPASHPPSATRVEAEAPGERALRHGVIRSSLPPPPEPKRELPAGSLDAEKLGMDRDSLRRSVARHIAYTQGKDEHAVTAHDLYFATARATRDRLVDRWNKTKQRNAQEGKKRVYYLSLEFLLGRLLEDALINLGLREPAKAALAEFGIDFTELCSREPDAGLGNAGLGRLAACFLDSMATLGLPAMGYGIRYEYGAFRQAIVGGRQKEYADTWLQNGFPWEMPRPEYRYLVKFGGRVLSSTDPSGRTRFQWVDTDNTETVEAMAYDVLVPGYQNGVVNTLRLWAAKARSEFNSRYANEGDYIRAVEEKNATENIARMLYPNDMVVEGRELRLKQEYFFASASLQDAVARHLRHHRDIRTLAEYAVFQLNDTQPALAIAELMRLLVDVCDLEWDDAWTITGQCMAYTNHTVLPEALETWPGWLMERVLPRHMQIIYEINARFLTDVRARHPGDEGRVQRVSLFDEVSERRIRMAHLALVGSYSVNGVSQLHGRLLRQQVFRDFADLFPQKFRAITNGITPRRWLLGCNPELAELITARIGDAWVARLEELARLVPATEEASFRAAWAEIKQHNKVRLANELRRQYGLELDPITIFDVHVKRIHEYKRQLLNILHIISLYLEYRERPPADIPPRSFIFAGKAAPGYAMAKRIIELVTGVAQVIAADPVVSQYLKVLFVPDYGVSWAELIVPAADVSEQISLAGMEASGTGNMKFALNGAVTVGTLDGANVEILEAVGEANIFVFGLSAGEVDGLRTRGYMPREVYDQHPHVRGVIDAICRGTFSPRDPERFRQLIDTLLYVDRYLVLADFESYRECHQAVAKAFQEPAAWTRRSILNTALSGRFSSDNTVQNYARDVWGLR
jgi:starch phosphorylase